MSMGTTTRVERAVNLRREQEQRGIRNFSVMCITAAGCSGWHGADKPTQGRSVQGVPTRDLSLPECPAWRPRRAPQAWSCVCNKPRP